MVNITNITEAITALRSLAEDLPTAVAIDDTLTKAMQAADAKAVGDAISTHTQAASTISTGTFAGEVVAKSSTQNPGSFLLRNSKLVSAETNPSNNGEICWIYE